MSLCATLSRGAVSLCATLCGGVASLGAALSLGRRGMLPLVSHDGGAVPSSVSCRSARVLALHAGRAEVAVVVVVVVGVAVGAVAVMMGAAVGAVAGVAWSAGWGSRCSLCGVESSLAPQAES